MLLLARGQPAWQEAPPAVLRGRALEIQIDPAGTAAGKHYPTTVMLRLVDGGEA